MRGFVMKVTMSILAVSAIVVASPLAPAFAQDGESNSALMARQQIRLNTIEDNLKSVRGALETEFRAIRLTLEELATANQEVTGAQAAAIKELKGKVLELGDTLDIFNQRLRRSIELSSDIEFRVLRMEKRMQTLLSLSGDNLADAILQEDVSAAGTAPSVAMSRDNKTGGASWSVAKDEIKDELAKITQSNEGDNSSDESAESVPDNQSAALLSDNQSADETAKSNADNATQTQEVVSEEEEAPISVLPDASPEEQFRFAFGQMLQNDLKTAEAGFAEFRDLYPDGERAADVLYWLGRVQFIQGDYGNAAMSFTEFNTQFPEDPRLPEAMLMVAESVVNFATNEQACQIFSDLPNMIKQPTDIFVKRLAELKTAASCDS